MMKQADCFIHICHISLELNCLVDEFLENHVVPFLFLRRADDSAECRFSRCVSIKQRGADDQLVL